MFNNISEQLTNKLLENKTICAENKGIYQFGIAQTLIMMLNILTAIGIGIVTQMLGHAIWFIIAFIPLRIFAGGAHAKTPFRCYIYSMIFLAAVLLIMRFVHIRYLIYCILYIISSITILLLAPVEDSNKLLDKLEKSIYKKRTIMLWIIESIITFVCFFLKLRIVTECFTMSIFSIAIIVVLGALKNKINTV